MTPLRQRMLEDMLVRNLSSNTQRAYIENVARFARHFGRSPADLGPEEIRAYQLYLIHERKLAPSSQQIAVCALRFLYKVTLKQPWSFDDLIPAPNKPRRLPVVLSPDEVVRFLACVTHPEHRTILTTCYAAGLRVSEAVRLRPTDVDSRRMVIRVEQGKGQRDRYVMLSPTLLELLRDWWREGFLLPVRVLSRLFRRLFLEYLDAAFKAGTLQLSGSLHALRDPHAWARALAPVRHIDWVVYAKRPFSGPQHVLEYVGRYTHRVAISNDRLRDIDHDEVRVTYKDYRADPAQSVKTMALAATEFIRRFLLHVLPLGFHRIRYYGFLGPRHRAEKLTRCRQLLGAPPALPPSVDGGNPTADPMPIAVRTRGSARLCPAFGRGHLIVIDRVPPTCRSSISPDTS